jgi:hypothetical protein
VLHGDEFAQSLQLIIEYAPEPPYSSGSVETAPTAIVERATNMLSGRFSDE